MTDDEPGGTYIPLWQVIGLAAAAYAVGMLGTYGMSLLLARPGVPDAVAADLTGTLAFGQIWLTALFLGVVGFIVVIRATARPEELQ